MVLSTLRRAWAQVASALLGLWLMAAPAVLGYAGTAADVHRIVGPVVASIAFIAVWDHMRPLHWANVPLAIVLVFLPWLVPFPSPAGTASFLTGLVLGLLSFVRGEVRGEFGGGWLSLLTGDVAGPDDAPTDR